MDGDAIKRFFAHHVEKFIVGLIAATAIFLIYSGTRYPNYLEKIQPERLQEDAQTVKQSIDVDHTEAIVETLPAKEGPDYPERVATLRNRIPHEIYEIPVLNPAKANASAVPRQDPQLFAPVDLRVQGVLGALAMKREATSYPAMELEDADPVEPEEEPRPRSSRSRSRERGAAGGSYGGGGETPYGSEMGGEGMGGGSYGGGPGGEGESYGGEGGGYGGGEMGGPGSYGTTTGKRRLNPKYDQGYQKAAGLGMTTGPMTAGPGAGDTEVLLPSVPQSSYFIAGTAAVPHKKLLESYKSALLDAAGYQAQRDRPIYSGFEVQRADVTGRSVDQLEEDDWLLVGDWEQHAKIALYQWDGFGAEIVPGDYRDDRLTAVIPPLLVYDFTHFVTHPLIPLKSLAEIAMEKQPQRRVQPRIEGPILPGRARNEKPDAAGTVDATGNPGARFDVGAMLGGPGGMGMRGPSGSLGDPDYKLVRFYDFLHRGETSLKLGREYVYRVRIGLEDPNFPKLPGMQPALSSLAADVFARVEPKALEFEANRERDFVIYSDWSDPSPAASLPDMTEVYAGPVDAANARVLDIGGKSIDYVSSPAKGKAVGLQWDWKLATNLPIELEVTPGSVLNAKQVAEVIDPLTKTIKKTEETNIETDITVVDLTGGERLQIVEKTDGEEEMTAPGTMLMFDAKGGLYVRDDVGDLRGYRMHTYADERETAKPVSMSDGDYGGEGGYGGSSPY